MIPSFPAFMINGGWALFSLIAAVFSMGFYLTNKYLKQPGDVLVFFMRVVTVIFLTPFVISMDMPQDPMFYVFVVMTALLGVGADIRTFDASSTYGGGVVSRLMPVTVWASFILWLVMRPQMLVDYAAHPWRTTGIVLSLAACVYFASRLRHEAITKAAARTMLPALIGYTLVAVLSKLAMEHGVVNHRFASAAIAYLYVQSLAAIFMLGPLLMWRRRRTTFIFTRYTAVAVLLAAFIWIDHMTYKNFAVAYTPHPSYQGAINLLTPVFIALFYKIVKHQEPKTDMVAGMGIVGATIFLTLMTI